MLLSVPVPVVRVREHGPTGALGAAAEPQHLGPSPATSAGEHPRAPSSSLRGSSGGGGGQGDFGSSPARRLMRAVLSITRQRQEQQQSRSKHRRRHQQHQQHQQQQQQRSIAVVASSAAAAAAPAAPAASTASLPVAASPAPPAAAPLLHSAASLPVLPPSLEELPQQQHLPHAHHHHHHHHRRRAGSVDSAAAAGDVAEASAASEAAPAAAAAAGEAESPALLRKKKNNPLRALLRFVIHHAHRAGRAARPRGPGLNDATAPERAVNVLTSLPFLAVGAHVLRTRRAPASRRFGRSFVAVGLAATAYHGCPRGHPLRRPLRLLDYYSICWSSSLLREAVGVRLPRWAAAAAAAATPIKPTAVTAGNLVAIELAFARAALCAGGGAWGGGPGGPGGSGVGAALRAPSDVRRAWRRHVAAAATGIAAFLAEDAVVASGRVNFNAFHGAWHLLSAAALGLANALLGHVEQALLLEAAEVVAEGQV